MSWRAVGLSVDVPNGVAVPARLNGTELAIWRSASGRIHAWGDRCPHRGMRLSHGFVRGEALACIYHGWQYDDTGACAYIPAHPDLAPPKSICARTYASAESSGLIWVSLSAPAGAPETIETATPVRSLPVDVPADRVADALGQPNGAVLRTPDIAIALQPMSPHNCMLHALALKKTRRHDASVWLEDLRITLEGVPA